MLPTAPRVLLPDMDFTYIPNSVTLFFANVSLGRSNRPMERVVSRWNLFIGLTECSHRPCGESCDGLFLSHVTPWIDWFSVRRDKYNRTSVQTHTAAFGLIQNALVGPFWRELERTIPSQANANANKTPAVLFTCLAQHAGPNCTAELSASL